MLIIDSNSLDMFPVQNCDSSMKTGTKLSSLYVEKDCPADVLYQKYDSLSSSLPGTKFRIFVSLRKSYRIEVLIKHFETDFQNLVFTLNSLVTSELKN